MDLEHAIKLLDAQVPCDVIFRKADRGIKPSKGAIAMSTFSENMNLSGIPTASGSACNSWVQ
jgi:hypothetical protein